MGQRARSAPRKLCNNNGSPHIPNHSQHLVLQHDYPRMLEWCTPISLSHADAHAYIRNIDAEDEQFVIL